MIISAASLPTKRDLEKLLRGAGLSARQSKKLLSAGYGALGIADAEADNDELKRLLTETIKRLES